MEDISKKGSQWTDYNSFRYEQSEDYDSNTVNISSFLNGRLGSLMFIK